MDVDVWAALQRLSAAFLGGIGLGLYIGDVRRLVWLLPTTTLSLIWLAHSGYVVIHTDRLLTLLEHTLRAEVLIAVLAVMGVRLGMRRV